MMPDMDSIIARKCRWTLEPYHAYVYFAPEPAERYEELGLEGQAGYFASRASPMGAVPAEVVIATFYNFHPDLVRSFIPAAWEVTTPEALLEARLDGADAMLRRVLGDETVGSPEMKEAADLARIAAEVATADVVGRPLLAGHASLDWPDQPHLDLWHALTLLREHRGDGHVAALVSHGVGPVEALILHEATGEVPSGLLRTIRAWPDEVWEATVDVLKSRGDLDEEGKLTEAGSTRREHVEHHTDELALGPWAELGEERCARLRELVRPYSRALVDAGMF